MVLNRWFDQLPNHFDGTALVYDTRHYNSFNMSGWLSSYVKPFSQYKLLRGNRQKHSVIEIIKIDVMYIFEIGGRKSLDLNIHVCPRDTLVTAK